MDNGNSSSRNLTFEENDIFDDSSFINKFQDTSFRSVNTSATTGNTSRDVLNISALCCDEEISGYDKITGKTWIYPTNYPVRDYQFNIIRAALVKNTLVSLPTGLGKTFIAAVIMYNFYRWYPMGKIIFMAPTRPLVAQQIDACYNIVAIPPNDTIEMTGHMQANNRKCHWATKRVFFATPQVIYNDIMSGICPSENIRCLVFDEAHRARGNYAYCQIIASLTDKGCKTFRVLALSATPGSKVEDVVNVVKHLHIAHLELRTEQCIDVAPYSHSRKVNTVVVPLGHELSQLRQQYVEILDDYARRLKQLDILPQNIGNLSKGRIVILYKEFQNKERAHRHPQHAYIMKDFTLLIALYHGLELLTKHGTRVFLNFFDDHPEKSWVQSDDRLTLLLERLRDDLGVNPLALDRSILPDGSMPELPKNLCFGHPKFDRLKEIMLDHFNNAKNKGQDTRAIVFCEYRESVNLVHCLLLQCRPIITAQMFVGQGASGKDGKTVISQKQQLRVMRGFREGACNVLVATCVAEEGLDVGSVDLIICFDISNRSPIRLVQRCGRTGRERGGQVHILVTEGKEHQTLLDCIRQKDGLNKRILQSREVKSNLYTLNPRMMPHDYMPECMKMHITAKPKTNTPDSDKKKNKGQKDLRHMLLNRASSSGSNSSLRDTDIYLNKEDFLSMFPEGYKSNEYFENSTMYCGFDKESFQKVSNNKAKSKLSQWMEWQRNLQKTVSIGHSKDTEVLTELLRLVETKRYDIPASQITTFSTQCINSIKDKPVKSPVKQAPVSKRKTKAPQTNKINNKDGDIRAIFSTATKSTKNYTKLISDLGIQNDGSIPTSIIDLLVDLTIEKTAPAVDCLICNNLCDCTVFKSFQKRKFNVRNILENPKYIDVNLIDDFTPDIFKITTSKPIDDSVCDVIEDKNNLSTNFDLEFNFESPELILNEEKETKFDNILISDDNFNKRDTNFDLGGLEDIFNTSSPEEAGVVKTELNDPPKPKETLEFFGLDSIEDIFADSDIEEIQERVVNEKVNSVNEKTINHKPILDVRPASPSLLSGSIKKKISPPTSPILCTQPRLKMNPTSTPIANKLFLEANNFKNISIINANEDKPNLMQPPNHSNISNNKSMFTITQLVDIINKTNDKSKNDHENTMNIHEERSDSPILLTQADRNKKNVSKNSDIKPDSLIILDSASDSDNDTIPYDKDVKTSQANILSTEGMRSPLATKRKFDENDNASPYFNKKPKTDQNPKTLSLQEKILSVINKKPPDKDDSNLKGPNKDNTTHVNPVFVSQKENFSPVKLNFDISLSCNPIDRLQSFRRNKLSINRNRKEKISKTQQVYTDDDDDFVLPLEVNKIQSYKDVEPKITQKKKSRKANSFLDLEAELSGCSRESGDELTDDSIGSIKEFLCDDHNETENDDMHAFYLKSVKNPQNVGAFKIPFLPKKINEDVLSQVVDEDDNDYEMDSFCVDSHIGLTQVPEMSILELAEMKLKSRRKAKRKNLADDSEIIVKPRKRLRRISSDDDSS